MKNHELDTGPLEPWGWRNKHQLAYDELALAERSCLPGRIVSQREDFFTLVTPEGQKSAHPAGVLFHKSTTSERPGVGDWVVLEAVDCSVTDEEDSLPITHSVVAVLPRSSCFLREAPGGRGEPQVVACNVDKVFVLSPANDVNLNRIERFAVAICSSGAIPAVVLSKADLVDPGDLAASISAIEMLMDGLQVLSVGGAHDPSAERLESFASVLEPGETYALVGASGVGKSTLVNALLGECVQDTGAVREGDNKGRHVTSFRELFALPGGALLMDTPGVREFAIWSQGSGSGMKAVFADINELEDMCRFADCSHQCEPDCAIAKAVSDGTLSDRRLENWRCLNQEAVDNEERQQIRQQRRERFKLRRKVKRDKRFSRS